MVHGAWILDSSTSFSTIDYEIAGFCSFFGPLYLSVKCCSGPRLNGYDRSFSKFSVLLESSFLCLFSISSAQLIAPVLLTSL
jgi:hypothetical protein